MLEDMAHWIFVEFVGQYRIWVALNIRRPLAWDKWTQQQGAAHKKPTGHSAIVLAHSFGFVYLCLPSLYLPLLLLRILNKCICILCVCVNIDVNIKIQKLKLFWKKGAQLLQKSGAVHNCHRISVSVESVFVWSSNFFLCLLIWNWLGNVSSCT